MLQVSSHTYDKDFFARVYGDDNNTVNLESNLSKDYYQEILTLTKVDKKASIVDFGCGNGTLSFFLAQKFGCSVLGIDYSKDAIKICNTRRTQIKKRYPNLDVNFQCSNNDKLPNLKNISAIFLCDVVEHMYDNEIAVVFNKFKEWGKPGLKVVIHTDNNLYLKRIRPVLELFEMILGKATRQEIAERKAVENKVHVNLTNPGKLKAFLEDLGYRQISVSYPRVTRKKINKQLAGLSKVPGLVRLVEVILNSAPVLSPSFFSVFTI